MSKQTIDYTKVSPDDFEETFTLPNRDEPSFKYLSVSLSKEQYFVVMDALKITATQITDTFGNTNKNGNALFELVRQWEEQKILLSK